MTDTLDAGTGTPPEGGDPAGGDGANMKRMRELAEKGQRAEELEAQMAATTKENAFLRSGIDIDTPLGAMFFKAFDGDATDVEALKAQAVEMNIPFRTGAAPTPAAGDPATPPESTGTEQRQQLANGAPADTGEQPHPNTVARQIFDTEMAAGGTWEDSAGMMIASKAAAAMSGDLRGTVPEKPIGL